MFKALIVKAKTVQSISQKEIFRYLFLDEEFTAYIIELNTVYQLYNLGIDSDGKRLDSGRNGYSDYTKQIKQEKGQPIDRVTLKDTRAFYASFKCKWLASGDDPAIQITANTIKEDDLKDKTDLLVEWGKDILGLDDTSLIALRNFAAIKIKRLVEARIQMAA